MIAQIVAFMKGAQALRDLAEMFINAWIKYDISKIETEGNEKKEEFYALEMAMKRTTNDAERIALLRTSNRLRSQL